MIIKKISIDTMLVIFAMLVAVMPTFLAKPLVAVSLFFLLLRIIISNEIFHYINKKIFIFILFLPGTLGAVFMAPEHLIRFLIVILIILGFPFLSFRIQQFPILITSILILIYLSVTQILLLQANQLIIDFRDFGYRNEYSYIFDHYGYVENIFREITYFFSYDYIRAGGLYFNPNVLAVVIILYFFIFDISWKNYNQIIGHNKKNYKKILIYLLIFSLVVFSIMLTKSRTVIISFLAYLIFQNFNLTDFLKFKFKKILILPALFTFMILLIFFEKIMIGIFSETGSANIKFAVIFEYLNEASIFDLLFGGRYNVRFDSEYGNWIGASGFFGVIAFYILYMMIFRFAPQAKALLISFLLISFGNTLFYNLLFASILVPLFVIFLSFDIKKLSK